MQCLLMFSPPPSHIQMGAWSSLSPLPIAQAEGQRNGQDRLGSRNTVVKVMTHSNFGHKLSSLFPRIMDILLIDTIPWSQEEMERKANAGGLEVPLLRSPAPGSATLLGQRLLRAGSGQASAQSSAGGLGPGWLGGVWEALVARLEITRLLLHLG